MLDLRECPMLIDAVRNGVKTVKANYTEYTLNNTLVRVDAQTELILPGCVPIDAEYFPDDNFRYVVSSSFDENSSGWLSLDEIADVVGFSIEDEDFTSIQGVEYFTELTSLLIDGAPSLTAADFTGNPALIYADVSSNGLQEIYLNGLNVLNDLSIENNNLTWLDVSSSPLTSLLCHNNPLTSLILGDQPGLTKLSAYGTDLAMLDLRGCPALAEIAATGTRTDHANYVEYRVDESHCLRVDADTEILLPGSVSADEMHFPDAVFRAYVRQYFDTDGSGWLNTAEIAAAKEIDPYETNASGFSDLRGIENLTELTYLGISNSPFLTSLDLSRNPKIKILDIWNTGLTALDLRGLTLRDVSVTRSPIQFLDLGIQEWLDSLVCTGCSVTQLDISGCPMLINAVRNGERTEENGKVTWLDSSWHWVTTDLGVRVRTGLDAESIFEPLNDTEQTSQIVFIGETANEPDEPMKIGAIFTGWYIGTECTEDFRFSFGTPVTENLTLYAGWIVPEPNGILKLPTMLNTIDAEAFDSVAAEAVIIPESVTAISGNPFTNSGVAYIYGFAGSEAQRFARSNEFIFVPIDSDWLGSH